MNDDNTFQALDYMLAPPKVKRAIRPRGCSSSVYKVKKVVHPSGNTTFGRGDGDPNTNYQKVQLFVMSVESPMEYMREVCSVHVYMSPSQRDIIGERGRKGQCACVSSEA